MLATKVTLPRLTATRTWLIPFAAHSRWASQISSSNNQQLPNATITKETVTTTSPSGAVTEKSETIEATASNTAAEPGFEGIINAIEPGLFENFKQTSNLDFLKTNTKDIFRSDNSSNGNVPPGLNNFLDLSDLDFDSTPYHIHVNTSPNNTIITLTRPNGSPLLTTSGGSAGFKKSARSGYEAAHQAALQLLEKINTKNIKVNNVNIVLKGFGAGRDAAYKALATANWNIKRITDATPVPFGGCRPKKQRRL